MVEIWKDIKGYEGYYQISNLGNVKSLRDFKNKKIICREKILKNHINKNGYVYIGLCKDKNHKTHRVHRLVAQTFIDNPDNLPQVNHIDGDKSNNCVDNLEWCTRSQNQIHAYKHNLSKITTKRMESFMKNRKDNSKKIFQYDLDGNFIQEFESMKKLADFLKIDSSVISRCCSNNKPYKNFIFKENPRCEIFIDRIDNNEI